MDAYYMVPSEEDLHRTMAQYEAWINEQLANVTQTVSNRQTTEGCSPRQTHPTGDDRFPETLRAFCPKRYTHTIESKNVYS
jgi:hypothetical protein